MSNCVIEFQPEAYETAADHLNRLLDLTVEVTTAEKPAEPSPAARSTRFTATVAGVYVDKEDGQWKLHLRVWPNDEEEPDPSSKPIILDPYDDIERLEVV